MRSDLWRRENLRYERACVRAELACGTDPTLAAVSWIHRKEDAAGSGISLVPGSGLANCIENK